MDFEKQAYFLGWMYSDGSVSYNTNAQSFSTKLKIHRNDKEILDLFKDLTNWTYGEDSHNGSDQVYLRTNNYEFAKSLIQKGVLPRKSIDNSKFIFLPDIDKSLIPFFIRGLFDGDGSYSITKNSRNRVAIYIGNTNYFLLKEIKLYLEENNIQSDFFKKTKGYTTDYYALRIRTVNDALIFKNLIFKDRLDLSLKRKKDIVLNANYDLEKVNNNKRKAVLVYDMDNTFLGEWKSCYEIEKLSKFNKDFLLNQLSEKGKIDYLNRTNIANACQTSKPYRGLIYKYDPCPFKTQLNGETPEKDNPVLNQQEIVVNA